MNKRALSGLREETTTYSSSVCCAALCARRGKRSSLLNNGIVHTDPSEQERCLHRRKSPIQMPLFKANIFPRAVTIATQGNLARAMISSGTSAACAAFHCPTLKDDIRPSQKAQHQMPFVWRIRSIFAGSPTPPLRDSSL